MTKKILALLLALVCTATIAFAEDTVDPSGVDELLSGEGISEVTEAIPPEAQQYLTDSGSIGDMVAKFSPQSIVKHIAITVKTQLTKPFRTFVSLCGVMVLCAMLAVFQTTLSGSSRSVFGVVVAVAIASVVVTPVVECITSTAITLRDYAFFISAYIPVFSGVMTAAGQPLTAAAYNIFLFWICQTTSQLISVWFVPLLCAFLALSVVSVVCPTLGLDRLIVGIRTFAVWGLTLTLTFFVGLMSVQSVVAYSGDNLTVKTAKFMIGSLVPGIGGVLSDLFVAAQGCIQLAKGTLGAFGVVVTLITFLPPILQVLLWYLSLNVASLVGSILGVTELGTLLKNISSTLGLLLAILLYDALLVIISTTIIIVTFNIR